MLIFFWVIIIDALFILPEPEWEMQLVKRVEEKECKNLVSCISLQLWPAVSCSRDVGHLRMSALYGTNIKRIRRLPPKLLFAGPNLCYNVPFTRCKNSTSFHFADSESVGVGNKVNFFFLWCTVVCISTLFSVYFAPIVCLIKVRVLFVSFSWRIAPISHVGDLPSQVPRIQKNCNLPKHARWNPDRRNH